MTDKEILAELKRSYEYMQDIRDNGCDDICNGQLNSEMRSDLFLIMEKLADIYSNIREKLSDNETSVVINNEEYHIGNSISEDYSEIYDEENNYTEYPTCANLCYYWYEDIDFLNK